MTNIVNEFVDGLKKPFQTATEQEANEANAVASYALVLGFIALIK